MGGGGNGGEGMREWRNECGMGRGKNHVPGLCYDDVVEWFSLATESRETDTDDHISLSLFALASLWDDGWVVGLACVWRET